LNSSRRIVAGMNPHQPLIDQLYREEILRAQADAAATVARHI
jgi:hypothetical protein